MTIHRRARSARTGRRRPSSRTDRAAAREKKRQRMLDAAIEVVRIQGPGVSMEEIARAAGVTKPIVYRAFGDREGLTAAVASRFADDLAVAISEAIVKASNDRGRVATTIDAYLAFIEREPAIVRFLVDRGLETHSTGRVATSGFVARIGQLVTQAISEAMRERGVDASPAEPWAYAIVGAVHMAGDWWLERQTLPRERLVEYLTSLVWDGMGALQTQGEEVGAGASRGKEN